jgi:hypothetical protein
LGATGPEGPFSGFTSTRLIVTSAGSGEASKRLERAIERV